MNIPGYAAERSLYRTARAYGGRYGASGASANPYIVPQGDCGCGIAFTECIAACIVASIFGGGPACLLGCAVKAAICNAGCSGGDGGGGGGGFGGGGGPCNCAVGQKCCGQCRVQVVAGRHQPVCGGGCVWSGQECPQLV
jgi:hypothetical protein